MELRRSENSDVRGSGDRGDAYLLALEVEETGKFW